MVTVSLQFNLHTIYGYYDKGISIICKIDKRTVQFLVTDKLNFYAVTSKVYTNTILLHSMYID